MRKFTVFTVILTIIIVIVVGEMVVDKYLPSLKAKMENFELSDISLPEDLDLSKVIETNLLGSDVDYSKIPSELLPGGEVTELGASSEDLQTGFGSGFANITPTLPEYKPDSGGNGEYLDFEDENFVSFSQNTYLREDMVLSAGFVSAYIEDEPHNGFLYKTIYVDDLQDVKVSKYLIRTNEALLVKVYVFDIGPSSGVTEVYEVLKVRGSEGLDVEINETSDFGDDSFFLNDARRADVAFLTVRFGALIYSFSYPKSYHPQVKNLVKLIDMEF